MAIAAPSTDPIAAQAYLQAALDYIQQNYARRAQVDWGAWRQQVAQALPSPRSVPDAYPAIRYAIHLLGDPHLQFFPPDEVQVMLQQEQVVGLGLMAVYPERVVVSVDAGGVAEHAGVRVGDRIERINDSSTRAMTSEDFFNALFSGSHVYLMLQRPGSGEALSVVIDHADYHYSVTGPQGQRLPNSIGYIALPGLSTVRRKFVPCF